ncbi:glutactin [Episyrphus balteatus]|uniref:glutactin n=1 Tax=Episyrphus balteatus TaxID=286459 RepID=UPI0024862F1A|nr:glutactin [Episyrphus balteatus]
MRRAMCLVASIVSVSLIAIIVINISTDVIADTNNDLLLLDLPGQGLIRGGKTYSAWTNQTIFQFLGVPFAESPSGALRFKAPVERLPWKNIRDASKYGLRCPEINTINNNNLNDDLEDCLNLCVYSKNLIERRPVIFYVYGGGFYNGSSQDHPPHYLLEKDIVLVVTQYRVGALGWLSTQTKEMPGNSPVLDVMLALQWVQKFIHLFGGDPEQVTIMSQSAGATVTGMLMISPKTPDGLFKRAIIQSGSILATWATNNHPLDLTKKVCNRLCAKCDEIEDIYGCLNKVDILSILKASTDLSFGMTINDVHGVMPHTPIELLNKKSNCYPIMTGSTKHDGTFVLATIYDALKASIGNMSLITPREFSSKMFDESNEEDITGLARNLLTTLLYNATELDGNDHKKLIPSYIDQAGSMFIKSPIFTFAMNIAKKKCPTYVYSFDYEGEWSRFGYEFGNEHYPFNGGAHHSNDNIYLFSTHTLNGKDTEISKKMVSLWTSFAIEGVPGTENAPVLLPLQKETGPYFHIDETISVGTDFFEELRVAVNDPRKEELIRPDVEF